MPFHDVNVLVLGCEVDEILRAGFAPREREYDIISVGR